MQVLTLRLDEGVRARLQKLADADGRTLSNYIRKILTDHVDQLPEEEP